MKYGIVEAIPIKEIFHNDEGIDEYMVLELQEGDGVVAGPCQVSELQPLFNLLNNP